MKSLEIDISSIHHVKCAGLDRQMIENRYILDFCVGNPHEGGYVAAQVHERVQLYRPFATAESRPRERAEAEVDRGTVEGVNRLPQLDADRFVGVELSRSTNQNLSEIGEDMPVVGAIGVGQCAPRDLAPKAGVVELVFEGAQARLDVSQAFAKSQLRERHAEKPVRTREAARTTVATVPPHARVEIVPWNNVHELSVREFSRVHAPPSTIWEYRAHTFLATTYLFLRRYIKFRNR